MGTDRPGVQEGMGAVTSPLGRRVWWLLGTAELVVAHESRRALSCPHKDSRTAPGYLHTLLPGQDAAHPWSSREPLLPQPSSRVPPGPSRAVTTLVAPPEPKPPPQGRVLPTEPLRAAQSRGDPPPPTATAAGGASARGGGGWPSPRPRWPPALPAPRLPGTSGTGHTSGRAEPGAEAFPF